MTNKEINYDISIREDSTVSCCNLTSSLCFSIDRLNETLLSKIKNLYLIYTFEKQENKLKISKSFTCINDDNEICRIEDEVFRFVNDIKLIDLLINNEKENIIYE